MAKAAVSTDGNRMRFDLVDLRLFVAVADAGSITQGALGAGLALASASARIKGLEAALGVTLLKRGRRGVELTEAGESLLDHARIVMHDVDAMRGDLAAFAGGARASVHLLANTSGLSEHLPKALAAFLREHPDINVDIEERESADIAAAIVAGAADLGFAAEHALPEQVERFLFSEDRLTLVAARRGAFAGRRQIDFREVIACDFVGLTSSTALQSHIAKHAARLGARLRFRARLRDFDAICQMVAAGVGVAVVPEAAARRCAQSMPIMMIKIRDPWASRRLAICARSFKALSRPARQLVEFLRSAER
jgi:DNA-binding transcriptional LysR family regulator